MESKQIVKAAKWSAVAMVVFGLSYASHAVGAWLRYGHTSNCSRRRGDPLLDLFMPVELLAGSLVR